MSRQQTREVPGPAPLQLRWPGRLILGLIFAVGTAFSAYLGIVLGMIVGLHKGLEGANEPRPGIGLAPDLTGVVDMFLGVGAGVMVGAVVGLLAGAALMWALCRYLLAPLLRMIPALVAR
jgi:hypothetical protein